MKKKILLSGIILFGSISLCAYQYEVAPMIGTNFSDDSSVLDDSSAFGLRVNKYVSDDNSIQFGYTYLNDIKYKNKASTKNRRTNDNCCDNPKVFPTDTTSNNNANGKIAGGGAGVNGANNGKNGAGNNANQANNGKIAGEGAGVNGANNSKKNGAENNANQANNGKNASNGQNIPGKGNGSSAVTGANGTTVIPPNIMKKVDSGFASGNTDLHQFYINGVHELNTQFQELKPYVYGGFGYEHVTEEKNGLESQGFFDAGAGLKYRITDNINLISDIQAIKKFDDKSLDFLGSVGIGFLFGDSIKQAPEAFVQIQTDEMTLQPKPIQMLPVTPVAEDGYYIQMAAAFKSELEKDCKHYIHEIHKAGFNHTVKDTTIRNKPVSLLLVGPYVSKADAKDDLRKLREIEQDAFIKHI
jgi:hypothetical protein